MGAEPSKASGASHEMMPIPKMDKEKWKHSMSPSKDTVTWFKSPEKKVSPKKKSLGMTEEELTSKLTATVQKVDLRTLEEQVGDGESIRSVNMWQAHVRLRPRENEVTHYFAWTPKNDPEQDYHLSPSLWHSCIFQFMFQLDITGKHDDGLDKRVDEEDLDDDGGYDVAKVAHGKVKGSSNSATEVFGTGGLHGEHSFFPNDKCVDRYRFIKLLQELGITKISDIDCENRWDSRMDRALTRQDEPLLGDFESMAAFGYIYDEKPSNKRPMISCRQVVGIIFEAMIQEATKFEKNKRVPEAPKSDLSKLYTGRKGVTRAQQLLEAERKRKVMAGRKRDLRGMVMTVKEYFTAYYALKLDEVYYLEWIQATEEGYQTRRNYAWEYLIQLGLIEMVRPLELLTSLRTNSIEDMEPYRPKNPREFDNFGVCPWMRRRLFQAVELFGNRIKSDRLYKQLHEEQRLKDRAQQAAAAAAALGGRSKNGVGLKVNDLTRAKEQVAVRAPRRKPRPLREEEADFRQMPTVKNFSSGLAVNKSVAMFTSDTKEWQLLDEIADLDLDFMDEV